MPIARWLKVFFASNKAGKSRYKSHGRCSSYAGKPAMIEMLEPRQMLSGDAVANIVIPYMNSISLTAESAPRNYITSTPPIAVSPGFSITDSTSDQLSGATVQITGNYHLGEDRLTFENSANIQWSWDESSGTLTLSGVASVSAYQAMLRSVSYQDVGGAPNTLQRSMTFQVTNGPSSGLQFFPMAATPTSLGTASSDTSFSQSSVTQLVNVIPFGASATVESSPLLYEQFDSATAISPLLQVTETTPLGVDGAKIQITGNYHAGEDRLTFDNTLNVQSTWDEATGTLTLVGFGQAADYQKLLRSVRYQDVGGNPTFGTRTVSFSLAHHDPMVQTPFQSLQPTPAPLKFDIGVATRDIRVVPSALSIITDASPLAYAINDPATVVSPGLYIASKSGDALMGATVRIMGNYQAGQDRLTFDNSGKVSWNWDEATGTLTLDGVASISAYETMLKSVRYQNVGGNPSSLVRTVSFTVNDGHGAHPDIVVPGMPRVDLGYDSNVAMRQINVVPTHQAGLFVGTESTPLQMPLQAAATAVSPGLYLTGADQLGGAQIQITGNYHVGEDRLSFDNTGNVQWTWDATTGTLTLVGNASIITYQNMLRSVTYQDVAGNPSNETRTLSFKTSDHLATSTLGSLTATTSLPVFDSNVAIRHITFGAPPVLSGVDSTPLAFKKGAPAATIAYGIQVADTESSELKGAKIQISGNYQAGQDRLSFDNSANVQWDWNPTTGTLTLTGTASLAAYQTMLRSVTYQNVGGAPNTLQRTISISVLDDTSIPVVAAYNSNTVTRRVNVSLT